MTDEERRMLKEMYSAFMDKKPGQDEALIETLISLSNEWKRITTKQPGQTGSLLEQISVMARDWQRMGWAARAMVFAALTAGGVITAWDTIKEWVGGIIR